jgi:hypothetical protein
VLDQRLDVRGGGLAVRVDDEVRMLLGDPRVPDRIALEAARLDQARRVIVRRVAEDRARVRKVERLRRDAPVQQGLDPLACARAVAAGKAEPRADEPLVRAERSALELDLAVSRLELAGGARAHCAVPVDRVDALDELPGLGPEAAGIHRQRATDGAGDAREEFRALQAAGRREARDLRTRDARFREHQVVVEPNRTTRAVHQHYGSPVSAVAHEEIRAEPHEAHALVVG